MGNKKGLTSVQKSNNPGNRHYVVLNDTELESARKKYGVQKMKELKAKFLE